MKHQRTASADAIFAAIVPTIEGIAATFGRSCEVLVHDYRDPEHSVVAVAGSLTGRRVGGSMSEIGLRVLARGAEATNELNYLTRTRDGRVLKCSTMPLRDVDGLLIGALCINVDITALRYVGDFVADIIGTAPDATSITAFANDFDDVVEALIREEETERAKPVATLSRDERLGLVQRLRDKGLFEVRGAAPRISQRLGISRAALYNDLAAVRDGGPE